MKHPARSRMTLREHLAELRKRGLIGAAAVLLATVVAFCFSTELIQMLAAPISDVHQASSAALNFTTVTSAFDLRVKISLAAGIVASSPVWIYQFWRYIAPALHRGERRLALGFGLSTTVLFLLGAAMGVMTAPHIIDLMAGFVPQGGAFFLQSDIYFEFLTKLALLVGVGFALPAVLVALNFMGVVSGRGLLGGWRVAILSITVLTAFATPAADVVSMVILAVPLIALFFAAVIISVLHDRRQVRGSEGSAPASAIDAESSFALTRAAKGRVRKRATSREDTYGRVSGLE